MVKGVSAVARDHDWESCRRLMSPKKDETDRDVDVFGFGQLSLNFHCLSFQTFRIFYMLLLSKTEITD